MQKTSFECLAQQWRQYPDHFVKPSKMLWRSLRKNPTQSAFTCSTPTMETPEKCVKAVQS